MSDTTILGKGSICFCFRKIIFVFLVKEQLLFGITPRQLKINLRQQVYNEKTWTNSIIIIVTNICVRNKITKQTAD